MYTKLFPKKNFMIFIILIASIHYSFGQAISNPGFDEPTITTQYITFSYDEAGNRIARNIVYVTTPKSADGGENLSSRNPDLTNQPELFVDQLDQKQIKIYPNPTQGQLKIEIEGEYIPANTQITVVSVQGVPVIQTQMTENPMIIDITPYPDGTYFMTIREHETQTTWTIIKI